MINLIKLHLLVAYAAFSCLLVFSTVYLRTYTDASYNEIGTLSMICSIASTIMQPLICSVADRHNAYKQCLLAAMSTMTLALAAFATIPFFTCLLPSYHHTNNNYNNATINGDHQQQHTEAHPFRLAWYLVSGTYFIGFVSFGLALVLSDVFTINKCLNSSSAGEHIGQYRFFGTIGWALGSICLGFMQQFNELPYLTLPMLVGCALALLDFGFLARMPNIKRHHQMAAPPSKIGLESLDLAATAKIPVKKLHLGQSLTLKASSGGRSSSSALHPKQGQPSTKLAGMAVAVAGGGSAGETGTGKARAATATTAAIGCKGEYAQFHSMGARRSCERIGFTVQLNLLIGLNRFDNYNLVKYLILLVVLGAAEQIYFVFNLQFMTEVLKERKSFSLFFTFSAILQLSKCAGEMLSLLWLAQPAIGLLGRDSVYMLCIILSGIGYAITGFLLPYLNIWVLAALGAQTGILLGLAYVLRTETGTCYLSLLDKLLLLENDHDEDASENLGGSRSSDEKVESSIQSGKLIFVAYLEQLKELYSIEPIRFALKATIQSIFLVACNGIGFALGPLLAGFWLNSINDQLALLYQHLAYAHLLALIMSSFLEFGLIRLLCGSKSKVDQMKIGHQSKI